MFKGKRKGQSILEYSVLIIILIGAFLTIQTYMKRGIQGRWQSAIDDLGDQYDPRYSNSQIIQTIQSNTSTEIFLTPLSGGTYTSRLDLTNSIETKSGYTNVGRY